MAQSLSKIYIHLIFHIKTTSPKIRENDLERLSKDVTISQIVEEIKRNSSRWIKNLDPAYYHFFAWQGGYAAYSISQSVVDKTLQYIANQKEHHTKHSFAEEYRAFLKLYNGNMMRISYSGIRQAGMIKLLPFQGDRLAYNIPRAMPWEGTEKGTRLKLHSLFLNFNSCPRSISS